MASGPQPPAASAYGWARHPDGRQVYLDEVVSFAYTETQFVAGGSSSFVSRVIARARRSGIFENI